MLSAIEVVRGIHDPALAISAAGRVTAVNEAASQLLGLPSDSVVGRRCAEVVRAVDGNGLPACRTEDCPILGCMAAGMAVHVPWRQWDAGGHTGEVSPSTVVFPAGSFDDDTAVILVIRCSDTDASGSESLSVPSLRLLGSVSLLGPKGCVIPRRRRTLEVLAFLGLAGPDGVHRDAIIDALWPSGLTADASTYARVLLTDLRHTLTLLGAADAVERSGQRYFLRRDALRIDAVEFRSGGLALLHSSAGGCELSVDAFERILALYGGDLGGDEDFGIWVLPERERLRQLYLNLLEFAVRAAVVCGDATRIVEYCRRALEMEPLQERFEVELVAAYAQLGQWTGAVREYRAFQDWLRHETGRPLSTAFERAVHEALARPGFHHAGTSRL
jgi:DNA-binding SARP family transcriptional activator